MKVQTNSGNYQSLSTQTEAVTSTGTSHRRPVSSQATDVSSSKESLWIEHFTSDGPPSYDGNSEDTYDHEIDSIATPGTRSEKDALPLEEARCVLVPNRAAVWWVRTAGLKLSTLAAAVLIHESILSSKDLDLYHGINTQEDSPEPTDPISGVFSATHGIVGGVINGIADYPIEATRILKADRPLAKGMAAEFALDSGKGVSRIVGTGLKAPMDITLGVAQGFGNLPKVYGDDTVREKKKVTGIGSGLMAAGKGFGFGLYDGISGLVTQPVKGAQKEGVLGFMKGFGKGIGGVVCKPAAGAVGLPAYAFKGIYEEINKTRGPNDEVIRLREQGEQEWDACEVDTKNEILRRWYEIQPPLYDFAEGKFQ